MINGVVTAFISRDDIFSKQKEILKIMFSDKALSVTTFDGIIEDNIYNLMSRDRMYFVDKILVLNSIKNTCREAMIYCAHTIKRFVNNFAYSGMQNLCVITGTYDITTDKFIGPRIKQFIGQFLPPSRGYSYYSESYPYKKFIVLNKTQKKIMIPIIDDWSYYLHTPLSLIILLLRYINLFVRENETDEKGILYLNYDGVIEKCRELLLKSSDSRNRNEAAFLSHFTRDTFLFLVMLKLQLLFRLEYDSQPSSSSIRITGPNTFMTAFKRENYNIISGTYEDKFYEIIKYYGENKTLLLSTFGGTTVESRVINYFNKKKEKNGI
jgi:hypothetical protein